MTGAGVRRIRSLSVAWSITSRDTYITEATTTQPMLLTVVDQVGTER